MSTFNFRGFDLRCVMIDDNPWFCVRDICDALGIHNTTNFIHNLQKTEVDSWRLSEVKNARANKIISERGFYEVVTRAQKKNPKAREFQDWVFGTVLPAICKDGGYIENEEKVVPLHLPSL